MGTPLPSPKGGGAPKFSAHLYCSQMAEWIKMALGMEVDLSPGDFVLDGAQPHPQKAAEPPSQFCAHFYCGQIAGCIKMPLGTEVGLGPGDTVRWGPSSSPPPKKSAQLPIFGRCLLWPNGCMYQDTTWYGGRPQPRRNCVRWRPSSPSSRGAQPLNFRPMSVIAKRLDGLRCHLVRR